MTNQACSECLDWLDSPLNAGRVTAENPVCPIRGAICVRFPGAVAPSPSPLDKAIASMRELAESLGFSREATERGLAIFARDEWHRRADLVDVSRRNEPVPIYSIDRLPARPGSDDRLPAIVAALEEKGRRLWLGREWRVQGIAIGGCVDAVGTGRKGAMRRQGHAHTSAKAAMRGWVCIASGRMDRVLTPTGRATALLIHEVAHVLSMSGHDARWRRTVAALGAPAEAAGYVRRST